MFAWRANFVAPLNRWNVQSRPRPQVSAFIWKHDFFFFRPLVSDENDYWKRSFSKTLFRVELFENAVFECTCGRNLSKKLTSHYLFQFTLRAHNSEYACVKQTRSGYRLKIIVFKSIHCKRVDRPKQCEIATCGPEFFWKRRKKSCVLKRIRIREDRA